MPQEHDTEKPSPEKKRLRLRRSADESAAKKPAGDHPAKDSTAANPVKPVDPAPPPARTPTNPERQPTDPAATPAKPETEPENQPEPIGAPGALMREALKKEQQAAAPAGRPIHEKSPNLPLIVAKLIILLILFGGGLSLVIHALFNLGGDDPAIPATAPARTTTSHSPDRQQSPPQPSPAPKSTIIILDENEVLPEITFDDAPPTPPPAPTPPSPPPPAPTQQLTQPPSPATKPAPAATATTPATPAEDPAVKRWLDQVAISGILGSRMILNQKVHNLGDTVSPDLGIRWTEVDHQQKILTFTDKNGATYTLRF